MENWRGYLKEGSEQLDPEQVELIEDFFGDIVAVLQAYEDDEKPEVEEGRSHRRRARRKRKRQEFVKKVKIKAGLDPDLAKKDFTPEQAALYDQARQQIKLQSDADEFRVLNTIANGSVLNVPIIKDAFELGGPALKLALATVVGAECIDNLTLTCVMSAFVSSGGQL